MRRPEPLPPPQIRSSQDEQRDGYAAEITVDIFLDGLPALAQEITQADETGGPQNRSAIRVKTELVRLQVAHTGGIRREMAHSGHEISERQAPMAHPPKPG